MVTRLTVVGTFKSAEAAETRDPQELPLATVREAAIHGWPPHSVGNTTRRPQHWSKLQPPQ